MYNTFIVTPGRRIWIRNTSSSVVTVLDQGFRVLREFSISDREIAGIHALPEAGVCIYTDKGILYYDEDGKPSQTPVELSAGTNGKSVVMMCSHGSDTYIGIKGEGLFRLTADGLQRQWDEESLTGVDGCTALLTDDNLWVSMDGREPVNFYRHKEEFTLGRPSEYQSDALNMFYLLGDGYILVITNKAVFRQHIGSGSYRAIGGEGLDGDGKLGITLRDRRGKLWIQYNYDELRRYAMEPDRLVLEASWPIEPTVCIWDDAAGNVYLLQSEGISRFTPEGHREEIQVGQHPEFWFCGQFDSGKVYFLADDAIWFLDDDFNFQPLDAAIPEPSCIWEDEHGDWWIGTRHSGVWRHSPQSGKSFQIDLGGKDVDRSINSISGDGKGSIWASSRFDFIHISDEGNSVLNLKNPAQESVRNNTNSLKVTENGTAVFGTRSRFFFFPADFSSEGAEIPLFLDGLVINGSTVMRSSWDTNQGNWYSISPAKTSIPRFNRRTNINSKVSTGTGFQPHNSSRPVIQGFTAAVIPSASGSCSPTADGAEKSSSSKSASSPHPGWHGPACCFTCCLHCPPSCSRPGSYSTPGLTARNSNSLSRKGRFLSR